MLPVAFISASQASGLGTERGDELPELIKLEESIVLTCDLVKASSPQHMEEAPALHVDAFCLPGEGVQ